MNEFMIKLRDAIDRIEKADALCPLQADLSARKAMRLIELVADSDMDVEQIAQLLKRLNAGDVLFTLMDH